MPRISNELSEKKKAFVTKKLRKTPEIKTSELQQAVYAEFGAKMNPATIKSIREQIGSGSAKAAA